MADHAKPLLKNGSYDTLKNVVEFVLPGLGTLYFTLAQIWHLPFPTEVVGSIAALALFGGILIKISTKSYDKSDEKFDGELVLGTDVDGVKYIEKISANIPFEEIQGRNDIVLKLEDSSQ